jgi:DNA invertase Pin-like site-specific DNA recombinase
MAELLVGYARCSTNSQDLTAQIDALTRLGVDAKRIYVDHGLTGATTVGAGLREALAAVHGGDTLAVTKLDRLARSVPDARVIADELTAQKVTLNIGGTVYDPTDPIGRLLFTALSMVAEFEADLARMRTREGMAIAKAKDRLQGKKPRLSPHQEAHLVELHRAGRHTTSELAELFNVARSTVYRAIRRAGTPTTAGPGAGEPSGGRRQAQEPVDC